MSSRIDQLKATLRQERAGLVAELEHKRLEVEELQRLIAALETVLGKEREAVAPRRIPAESRRLAQEKDEIRAAIRAVLEAAPDGLTSEALSEQVRLHLGTPDAIGAQRIGMLCRKMADRGEGVIGDPTGWIYVPEETQE